MNKTAIKNFAIWARRKLIADVSFQAGLAGVTESGIASELPQSSGNVKFYDIGTKDPVSISGEKIRMRQRLVDAIREKEKDGSYPDAFRFVVEKVAYTWFNRLIAIRFMEVNDYLPGRTRVLSSENPMKAEPDLVTSPFDSDLTFTDQEKKTILQMKDENRLDELFRFLFIRQCHELHSSLPVLFDEGTGIDRADSYLELLLTISFTDKDGVLWHLVHDISEDDFNVEKEGQVEIIGWMYQYYNTEPKDQVFANLKKNIKISKDSIPAATQLFTPDWIVRYMVENSLGRLWVEGHPNEELKKNWKYYLEEAEQEPQVQAQLAEIRKEYAALRPEEIKVIDPCMGSGHILVYLFDVLMQIYESQGWTQREAAQSIVQNNVYGLDIDDRAAQLAYFAVMMKARQYDRRFLEREIEPHVYAIQESNNINRDQVKLFGKGMSTLDKNNAIAQLNELLDALRDAKEYGSILNVPKLDWNLLRQYAVEIEGSGQIGLESIGIDEVLDKVKRLINQAQTMAQKYHAVVTNPPYMGASGMGIKLSQFVKDYYPDSKSDLFAIFMEKGPKMLDHLGLQAMITQHSWMFLSSYEELRNKVMKYDIINMVHLGPRAFDEINGEVVQATSFVLRKSNTIGWRGVYHRLVNGTNEQNKATMLLSGRYSYIAKVSELEIIPGSPIAYWLSPNVRNAFTHGKALKEIASPRHGLTTFKNDLFLRFWTEIDYTNLKTDANSRNEAKECRMKWFPYNKGGEYRKWYGNMWFVINWEDDGRDIKQFIKNKNPNVACSEICYFNECLTWSLTGNNFGVRYRPNGSIFDVSGMSMFGDHDTLIKLMAFLNSKIPLTFIHAINPTLSTQAGDVSKIPYLGAETDSAEIKTLALDCLSISKTDWDLSELSWGFQHHPLVRSVSNVSEAYQQWKTECDQRLLLLKSNEERINRIYIDSYKLQNELSPIVDDKDITLYRAEVGRDVRSLLSYAVGCMFGRYSLDTDGLIFAGGKWDLSKYTKYIPDSDNCIPITDEPYFEDDIVGRFIEFVRVVYGSETLEENLDFIAKAISLKGNSSREIIRNYFLNDFFKDHCSLYSVSGSGKRPIYWMFDSGKQNGFKALVYMHRWNADTVGNLRVEYLHRMQRVYEKEIERMQDIIDNSDDNREINQASKRREKLVKQLKEARDYDAKIAHAALSRVEIDLDDGVKVNYEKVQKGPDGKSLGILAKI